MKKIPVLLIFLIIASAATAQSPQQKTDSVCQLVKKYMNEKSADSLYQLTGKRFHDMMAIGTFKGILEAQLFPLGELRETWPEGSKGGVSKYKAIFAATTLSLYLSQDSAGKLESFLFQPYKDENARKTYKVPFSNPLSTPLDNKVHEIAESYIVLLNTVGLSIGILKDGKTYFYDYGETAKGNKQIPDSLTLFEIGSISKTFTSTLLAIAVGEGKLRLSDPVNKYLPDSIPLLQYNKRVMRLTDLANHTSGIPRMPSNFLGTVVNNQDPFANYSVEDLFSFLKHFQLTREPGQQYEYSNTAVGLLGVILQDLYHQSYEELIDKYICDPLGMKDTRVVIRKSDSSLVAKGYNANGQSNPPWNLPASVAGAGAIRSSARDMLIYARADLGDASGALNKAIQLTHDTTFSNSRNTLGLAWIYIDAADGKIIFHNGATGGYRTYLAIDLQKKCAVVLLANSAIDPDKEGNALIAWLSRH